MFDVIKRGFWGYILEIVLAIVIFNFFGLEAFLIYLLIVLLLKIDMVTDYLRKLIRTFQVYNEIRTTAIIKKLKISEQEMKVVMEEVNNNLTEEQKKSLDKDFRDLGQNH